LADVFISYARSDQAIAARVAKGLQTAGLDVWWDADLPAHRAYSEIIERNLDEAGAVVVLWSKVAAKSQWVRAEADFARNAGKLVQATVDGSIPPMPFNQIQCADLKVWRGAAGHAGWSKLNASVRALITGEDAPRATASLSWQDRLRANRWSLAAGFALVLAALGLFLFLARPGEERKPILAVLPFRPVAAQDENLVAGIWEDTRTAIGRNPQLIVLGPNTAQQLAEKGEGAARKAADYLLEASVRTAGDKIRVSADLVRTRDGEQVWSQDFDRKLDDVFALQSEIANQIEGRIRGRLAERGGIMPEHIATSGDVYALYSDARAKLRKRDFSDEAADARQQLLQVVRLDPNFAPGWAALAEADQLTPPSRKNWDTALHAEEWARTAIDLAPNLAAAHAALAFALNLKGPVAAAELERAEQLDPSDFEVVTWLGNMRIDAGDKNGALAYYTRALQIEPLFWPAVLNKYATLRDLGDEPGVAQLVSDEKRLGGDYFGTAIAIDRAYSAGDLARAANLGLAYWATGRKAGRTVVAITMTDVLLKLGFIEEAYAFGGPGPPFRKLLWLNDPKGVDVIESHGMDARTFFKLMPLTENAGRVFVLSGRSAELANKYLSLKLPVEEFSRLGEPEHFLYSAPIIAVALQKSGHSKEARDLLAYAEAQAKEGLKSGTPESSVLLARIYAAQARRPEAVPLLASAVARGWTPDPPVLQTDFYNDPALATLRGDPRFEQLREQVLATIARMRAQVHPDLVKRAMAAN
jgi:adenylate cyclase